MPILTIVGPTGIGKTTLALNLAGQFNAELISADSRQVYIGMDIATGKEVGKGQWQTINNRRTLNIDGVLIHGLDVVAPNQPFSVADWHTLAMQLIQEITDRGHQAIIVGGTGFYLDALMGKVQTISIPPDQQLRQELSHLSTDQLWQTLQTLNPAKALSLNHSDRHNPPRLIRAIEIAQNHPLIKATHPSVDVALLGLTMDLEALRHQVDSRIDQMLDHGLVDETKQLLADYSPSIPAMTGIGYREMADHLNGNLTQPQTIALIKKRTHQYIKRQYTWFKARPVHWLNVDQPDWQAQALAFAHSIITNR